MADPPWTEAHLRKHLQHAVELELFTIPAYLCAYYSIRQAASPAAQAAADALLAIANQEMMHLDRAGSRAWRSFDHGHGLAQWAARRTIEHDPRFA